VILGIDTSAAQCAVALVGAGDPVVERAPMDRGHAEHLFPMIESVLSRAGAGYGDLRRIGVCTGPGSFTGVRIGVAAARGLALGVGVPAIGVSRFEALAAEAGGSLAICLAGRGGTVFLQAFDVDGAPLASPVMTDEDGLAAAIPSGIGRLAGDATATLVGAAALLSHGLADPVIIARLAAARAPSAPPAPLYLRGANAELPREGPPVLLD